jgi:putative isomerase
MARLLPLFAVCAASATPAAAPVSFAIYNNSALAFAPASTLSLPGLYNLSIETPASFSAELTTLLSFPRAPAWYVFSCALDPRVRVAFVWVDDHLICSAGPYAPPANSTDGSQANPIYQRPAARRAVVVRAHFFVSSKSPPDLSFSLQWCETAAPSAGCAPAPIPEAALAPGLPPQEAARVALQRGLATGWGLWLHGDVLSIVGLPSSARLKLLLCRVSTADCLQHVGSIHPAGALRVGLHAHDRSIAQMYLAYAGVNASITVLGGVAGLSVLVEVVGGCAAPLNCSDYVVALAGSFAWAREGAVSAAPDGASLSLAPMGQAPFAVYRSAGGGTPPPLPPNATGSPHIIAPLAAGAAAFAVGGGPPSVDALRAAAAAAAAAELARYRAYGDLSEVAGGVQAAVAWTVVYTPSQLGPFPPVTRDWDFSFQTGAFPTAEWSTVMFGWDNLFGALLLGASARDAAYSALIQAVRTKAAAGFVSNFEAGGAKSQDRMEPMVGARVLWELYKKYGDAWLVELLLDDFLDWADWVWRRRRDALGLIALGSEYVPGFNLYSPNTMQGARFESGLDNSPMYDGDYFDAAATHQMLAADVGMSSLFAAECDTLAALARAVNRSGDASALEARAASVRDLITSRLWDDAAGTFKNYLTVNNTLSTRVSPTSFYALAAGAASDAQAARMATEWALNASRFCLSETWPLGVQSRCFWGLPSISADDPAFPALGYWRGYVWGPMAQLTWWGFERYAHVPQVAAAKAALAKQMAATFVEQWRLTRHVCENFDPRQGAVNCTGDKFYHWGALAGLLMLWERGLY